MSSEIESVADQLRAISKPMSGEQPWSLGGLYVGERDGDLLWSVEIIGPTEIDAERRECAGSGVIWTNRIGTGVVGVVLSSTGPGLVSEADAILRALGARARPGSRQLRVEDR